MYIVHCTLYIPQMFSDMYTALYIVHTSTSTCRCTCTCIHVRCTHTLKEGIFLRMSTISAAVKGGSCLPVPGVMKISL